MFKLIRTSAFFFILWISPALFADTFSFADELVLTNQVQIGGSLVITFPKEVSGWNVEIYSLQMRRLLKVPQTPLLDNGKRWVLTVPVPANLIPGFYILMIQTDQFEKTVKIHANP